MAEKLCPFPGESGVRGPCIEQRCHLYIQLLGKHPQKDAPVEEWGCTFRFIPILQIEIAQQIRHFAAAVESARNVAHQDAASGMASMIEVANEVRGLARSFLPASGRVVNGQDDRRRLGFVQRLFFRGSD